MIGVGIEMHEVKFSKGVLLACALPQGQLKSGVS
jgi:hypothetical protein